MEFATGAMSNLLPKLRELLKEEYKLQTGVREQVRSLLQELEIMQAALRKVGEMPRDQLDEQVKRWARDASEQSYDMEDAVDAFLVRVDDREATDQQHRLEQLLEKMGSLFGKGKACRQIAKAIEEINSRDQEVANKHGRYTLDRIVATPAAASSTIDPRLLAMYKDAAPLVGVDGLRDELIKMLSEGGDDASKKKTKIISVFGGPGLGKTTLARSVYDKLRPDFDCRAFVPIGQDPDMKKVFNDITISLGIDIDEEKYMNLNMTMLDERQLIINDLREFLQNKRYFIVIDDIWEKKSWEIIRRALVDNCCGSIIVTTTDIFEVAEDVGDVYKLEPLSRENSEKLFNIRLVDCEGKCYRNQSTEVYDKILKKCGGVPLAIITIASLLASKLSEEWCEVFSSIGFGDADDDDVDQNTRNILSFSCNHLPSHLRACLLYLSVFPEDYGIDKNMLIWKWIAEGFVHEEQGIGLLEVGERYFSELVNRSMIQTVQVLDEGGYLYGCRVHDMVLDLIRSLSGEENFVTILDNRQPASPRSSNARRLALQKRLQDQNPLADMGVLHCVRSFTAVSCRDSMMVSPSFRVLRVLAIERCRFMEGGYNDGLEHLGNLLHLRYLGLTFTPVGELPKEVGHLKFLQTLDLCGTGIEELPSSVGLLTQLMCLRADGETRVPDWIGNLTSLQELWIFAAADRFAVFAKELGSLRELRVLVAEIDGLDVGLERALMESLGNLHKIQFVHIGGNPLQKGATWEAGFACPRHLRYLSLECLEFSRLPAWIDSSLLLNLSSLQVAVQVVQEQDMETLGRLPELRHLILRSMYTQVVSSSIIGGGDGQQHMRFHKLRSLETNFAFHRRVHGVAPTATIIMPSLEALEFHVPVSFLKDAANLGFDNLSLDNHHLPSLQQVTAYIDCEYASAAEVEEAEAALLRHAAALYPNRPTFQMPRIREHRMLSSDDRHEERRATYSCKVLERYVIVRLQKDTRHFFNFCDLLWNPCLEEVSVCIDCEDARVGEVEEAEAALRFATDAHPNHPTLQIKRRNQDTMMQSDQHQQRAIYNRKVLHWNVDVRKEKDADHCFNFHWLLSDKPCLETFSVSMDCEDATLGEVEEAEAALRLATDAHTNHPTLQIKRRNQDKMMLSEQHRQVLKSMR